MLIPSYGEMFYLLFETEKELGLRKRGLYLVDEQGNELFFISKTSEEGRYIREILGYKEV